MQCFVTSLPVRAVYKGASWRVLSWTTTSSPSHWLSMWRLGRAAGTAELYIYIYIYTYIFILLVYLYLLIFIFVLQNISFHLDRYYVLFDHMMFYFIVFWTCTRFMDWLLIIYCPLFHHVISCDLIWNTWYISLDVQSFFIFIVTLFIFFCRGLPFTF